MKTQKILRTTWLLFLACFLFLSGCQGIDPVSEASSGPSLQGMEKPPMHLGGGPCPLDQFNSIYTVGATYVTPITGYDFAIQLVALDSCRAVFDDPMHCTIRHGQINFSFPDDVNDPYYVNLNQFEDIVAYDYDHPNVKTIWEGLSESGLTVEGNSVLHFKWHQGAAHVLPARERLSTGGICILGVITEPCPQCPPQNRPLVPFIRRPRHL